jgi:hypothetical protein
MAVYVDALIANGWKLRGRLVKNCHLIADDVAELKSFAVGRLGMKESWFQPGSTPHFDLVESRRKAAVAFGAIELNRTDFVAKIRELREKKQNAKID